MIRFLLAFVVALVALIATDEAPAASRTLTRAEIRAMPMRSRPNRPGHFIGNTVRFMSRR